MIIINIAVIIIAICSLVSIIADGIKVANVSSVIIALFVSFSFKRKHQKEGHYEFSVAKLSLLNDRMIIEHEQYNEKITFNFSAIETLEYSDKLQCLRIVGNHIFENNKENKETDGEYLFYLSYDETKEMIDSIENLSNVKINYVDRLSQM